MESRQGFRRLLVVMVAALCQTLVSADQKLLSVGSGTVQIAGCSSCNLLALELILPGICPIIQELTESEVVAAADNATVYNTHLYTFDELYVCCTAASSPDLLLNFLRYSNIKELTLEKCTQDFSASMNNKIVIYGLEKISIISDTSSDYPRHTLDFPQLDESDLTIQYSNYHIAFLYQNLLQGSLDKRSFSVIFSQSDASLPAALTAPLLRAPSTVREKGDGTFMVTLVYGK